MKHKYFFFDLDGTLRQTKDGKTTKKMKVEFRYSRNYLPHSEYKVQNVLKLLFPSLEGTYSIKTSTAAIFAIVRAYCFRNGIPLQGFYEGVDMKIDNEMRMKDWSNYPDLNINDDCLEILLAPKNEIENWQKESIHKL